MTPSVLASIRLLTNTMVFLMSLLAMKAHCDAKHSVVIESQPPCNHVGVHVVMRIEECDGLCITNGLWLVVLGDEPHLSLFPRLWHPYIPSFQTSTNPLTTSGHVLLLNSILKVISDWWLPNTVSSVMIDEEGFQFTDVFMLFSFPFHCQSDFFWTLNHVSWCLVWRLC